MAGSNLFKTKTTVMKSGAKVSIQTNIGCCLTGTVARALKCRSNERNVGATGLLML